MIGDGTIVGGAVQPRVVMSRSSAVDADIRAGTVLVDSSVTGVTVAGATLIGVRVSGKGSIRGRLVIRVGDSWTAEMVDGARVSERCVLEGVQVFGPGEIRGQVWIEPMVSEAEQA